MCSIVEIVFPVQYTLLIGEVAADVPVPWPTFHPGKEEEGLHFHGKGCFMCTVIECLRLNFILSFLKPKFQANNLQNE